MAITRRNLLGHVGGAYLASAMVAETTVADASMLAGAPLSAELARLIEAHRAAYEAIGAYGDERAAAKEALWRDETNDEARRAEEATQAVELALCRAERVALVALLSFPFANLAELRAVLTVTKDTWWDHADPEDGEFAALLVGIMGGMTRDGNVSS